MMTRKEVEDVKKKYPKGTRVQLDHMEGETSVPVGTKRTVTIVDDMGTIHVAWENGSSLGLCTECDRFHIINN